MLTEVLQQLEKKPLSTGEQVYLTVKSLVGQHPEAWLVLNASSENQGSVRVVTICHTIEASYQLVFSISNSGGLLTESLQLFKGSDAIYRLDVKETEDSTREAEKIMVLLALFPITISEAPAILDMYTSCLHDKLALISDRWTETQIPADRALKILSSATLTSPDNHYPQAVPLSVVSTHLHPQPPRLPTAQ